MHSVTRYQIIFVGGQGPSLLAKCFLESQGAMLLVGQGKTDSDCSAMQHNKELSVFSPNFGVACPCVPCSCAPVYVVTNKKVLKDYVS